MNDIELLEMAAKAIHRPENYANIPYMEGWYSRWNPLTDDVAALRLAATLKADVKYHDGGVSAYIERCEQGYFEDIGDDPYAATRRAIVRAAAELGRNMK